MDTYKLKNRHLQALKKTNTHKTFKIVRVASLSANNLIILTFETYQCFIWESLSYMYQQNHLLLKAELSLLMMGGEADDKKHFNYSDLIEQDGQKKKKKKDKGKVNKSQEDEFKVLSYIVWKD